MVVVEQRQWTTRRTRAKARTRYIPRRMGIAEFLAAYEKHLIKVKEEKNQIQ